MKKLLLLLAIIVPLCVLAHGGGQDSFGGHTNHATGWYHYHHGADRPHSHFLGYCPVDADFKNGETLTFLIIFVLSVMFYLVLYQKPFPTENK